MTSSIAVPKYSQTNPTYASTAFRVGFPLGMRMAPQGATRVPSPRSGFILNEKGGTTVPMRLFFRLVQATASFAVVALGACSAASNPIAASNPPTASNLVRPSIANLSTPLVHTFGSIGRQRFVVKRHPSGTFDLVGSVEALAGEAYTGSAWTPLQAVAGASNEFIDEDGTQRRSRTTISRRPSALGPDLSRRRAAIRVHSAGSIPLLT